MIPPLRRYLSFTLISIFFFVVLFNIFARPPGHGHTHDRPPPPRPRPIDSVLHPGKLKPKFKWKDVKLKHPVHEYAQIPIGLRVDTIPRVQCDFELESKAHAAWRKECLKAVEEAFQHSWKGYKDNA